MVLTQISHAMIYTKSIYLMTDDRIEKHKNYDDFDILVFYFNIYLGSAVKIH